MERELQTEKGGQKVCRKFHWLVVCRVFLLGQPVLTETLSFWTTEALYYSSERVSTFLSVLGSNLINFPDALTPVTAEATIKKGYLYYVFIRNQFHI